MITNRVLVGDSLDVLKTLDDNCVDSIVTDPPYELGFMGRGWDSSGIAFNVDLWRECLRVLKPGGHLLAFSGTRTYHRMAVAIEDAGFDIRDCIQWIYGTGFPKSLDVAKAIDKVAGHWRGRAGAPVTSNGAMSGPNYQRTDKGAPITDDAKLWDGWGTALKPANEPICVARKPLIGTVADNVMTHGTGCLNIDGCRIGRDVVGWGGHSSGGYEGGWVTDEAGGRPVEGRWPANVILDDITARVVDQKAGAGTSRFFYVVKPDNRERDCGGLSDAPKQDSGALSGRADGSLGGALRQRANTHTTVKPIDLMRYLCLLVTKPDGIVLDPFCGSGTTLIAADDEGFRWIGIDLLEEHAEIARARLRLGGLFDLAA